ncbi:MAG: hypothetical protein FWG16_06445, partial [Micrococcales bacterium]|nr:hypothetical protein [Micrococcales bacterium]
EKATNNALCGDAFSERPIPYLAIYLQRCPRFALRSGGNSGSEVRHTGEITVYRATAFSFSKNPECELVA